MIEISHTTHFLSYVRQSLTSNNTYLDGINKENIAQTVNFICYPLGLHDIHFTIIVFDNLSIKISARTPSSIDGESLSMGSITSEKACILDV